jgi:hypothetical protein
MRYQQPSMEGTLFAMRNAEGGRGMVRNILIGQAANSVGNMLLDAFEPEQRKRDEEKDLGDRFRDFTRTALNIGTGANYAYQMARGYGLFDKQPKGAVQGENQNFNEQPPASPPPRPGAAEQAPSQVEGYAPYGLLKGSERMVEGYAPYGLLKGSEPTMTERTRQGEELVKAARAERMPGLVVTDLSAMVDDDMMNRLRGVQNVVVSDLGPANDDMMNQSRGVKRGGVTDLSAMVDDDMMNRLKGLEREAASYPKRTEEPSDYEKGVAAGMEAMAMRNLQSQAPSQTIDVTFTEPERRSTAYVAPKRSSNPLLSREPMGFNETYGVKGGVPMARDARKEEDAESLANFYANLPTNPETGERDLGNFASKYLVSKGSIDPDTVMVVDPEVDQPRTSGGLLQGQLRGETLYNQQKNREPFVQDQQMDAIYSGDEQGPGFTSGSLADMFLQQAQALAQSDARLYRNVGERISNMKRILSGAEEVPEQKYTQALQNTSAQGAAQEQMQNFMAQMLDDNEASNKRIQEQVAARETPRFAPSPEMVPNYVRPEFRAVSEQPPARVAPSMTLSEEPTVKKTTIIEETVPAAQQRMSPLEASERLRRIQTSGRPTARQEAQDFLQSIRGQMING